MKSAYYTAVVTNAYRMAIDSYLRDPDGYVYDEALMRELESVSHREYATGYYLDEPIFNAQTAQNTGYIREKAYFATAVEYDTCELPHGVAAQTEKGRLYKFIQRNKVSVGDMAEIISPSRIGRPFRVEQIYDENGAPLESAPHPAMLFFVRVPFEVRTGDIRRSGRE